MIITATLVYVIMSVGIIWVLIIIEDALTRIADALEKLAKEQK